MLRLLEHYVSVQGEGPRVGRLTQFVRFAGCNMRCPGWPCDTQHAIEPSIWRHESERREPFSIAKQITEKAQETGAYNICLTGGEPFLQSSQDLYDVIRPLAVPAKRYTFEVFTNGSFMFPYWTKDPLIEMLYMMDWKLAGSGEQNTGLEQRKKNIALLDWNDGIKFVVTDRNDLNLALEWSRIIRDEFKFRGIFWVGAAWGRITDQEVIQFMTEHQLDWRLNVQVHKHIWHPDEQGV